MKNGNKRGQHGMTLLLHGRKIATDAAKSGGPRSTAKGARNLLLHFSHPQIPFSEIVRKRKPQIIERSQHLVSTRNESIKQVLRLGLLGPAFAVWGSGRWRLGGITSSQDLEI